jgi:hypothetical protein
MGRAMQKQILTLLIAEEMHLQSALRNAEEGIIV